MLAMSISALAIGYSHKNVLNELDIDVIFKSFMCNEQQWRHFLTYLQLFKL